MYRTTKEKAKDSVPEILAHIEQGTRPTKERDTIVVLRAIEILGNIITYPQSTAYEIAKRLGIAPQTVFQYLGGLQEGGIPLIRQAADYSSQETGRKETLFSLRVRLLEIEIPNK